MMKLGDIGQLVGLGWRRHRRGTALDDDQWRFVAGLVETAAGRWQEPDRSIWEWRGDPKHFTYSKAACWSALQRGLDLAASAGRDAPAERWEQARDAVRAAVLDRGVHPDHGGFTQAFESTAMDAAVLLLPETGFVAWDDERMVATVDAVVEALGEDGLLRRYAEDDGLPGREGAFLACSFWLVECLARQGRRAEAERAFARAAGTASPLGLFSEEYDPRSGTALGNTPQALTHLAHIGAALALDGRPPEPGG
jgi:GH15 family glucan-1,4-alpha-glucosidase